MQSTRYLVVAAIVAAAIGMGGGWWAAQPDSHLSQVERLGAEIGCQCVTCPNRPIATCGCPFAAGMLTELAALADGSLDDEAILATFATRYNPTVRIKPASTGIGLLAWLAPMVLLSVGAVGVGALLLRWASSYEAATRITASSAPVDSSVAGSDADEARAIVERELEDLAD